MILLGISAPNTTRVRTIITTLINQLQLFNVNIRQPALAALAALLEVSEHELVRHTEPHRHFKRWGKNLIELENSLCQLVRAGNPLCFTDYAENKMQSLEARIKIKLNSGYIITGIQTEQEAKWLRERGGTLLHVYDYQAIGFQYVDEHDSDQSLVISTDNEHALAQLIATIETTHNHAEAA
jgi:hypothetical protein